MKKIIAFIAFLVLVVPQAESSGSILVATYNIRVETPGDTACRAWKNRKADVARLINEYDFDIFGVQEVASVKQKSELSELIPAYTYIGKGRDNEERTAGEQIGIFYKASRFQLKEKGSFFLSETPEKMSKGWDADYRRMCVWAKMIDRKSKTTFYFFCTHLDHVGKKARAESAKLIVEQIKKIAGNNPVICVGDFNASPLEKDMYENMSAHLRDSREFSQVPPTGPVGTFNAFNDPLQSISENRQIDYIFCSRNINVQNYKVLTDRYNACTWPSDHFPVMVRCKIVTNKKESKS